MPERRRPGPAGLNRRLLARRLKETLPDYPAELIKAALEEIINALAGALAGGRPVILRGFGRFQPRRYLKGPKKVGLIFRPSPALSARVNQGSCPGPNSAER
ncbi:hypothetical protein LJB86_03770 [Deltaproteobacteria bacterium OttesenSCG-928-M10]|nr:hypothetical protein [Deltaproteobacteria bacterium OttesenSCG-928-M10]